jgi:acyl-CoA thioesterase FadM
MNLYLRVLYVFFRSFFVQKINPFTTTTCLRLRVWVNDLDTNFHLNNGRYLTLMDLGRFDLILRSGLWRLMIKHKSVPILSAATIRYRLPLDPLQPFDLETRILCWDEKWVYLEQRFNHITGKTKGAVAAIALVRGSFLDRQLGKTIPTSVLLADLGITELSPPMPDTVATWLLADAALRQVTTEKRVE